MLARIEMRDRQWRSWRVLKPLFCTATRASFLAPQECRPREAATLIMVARDDAVQGEDGTMIMNLLHQWLMEVSWGP